MISVIIPTFNSAKWLPEAIESCIHQNCEVIVVDDGSQDNTLDICFNYPVYTIHQVNKGLASARNTGIMNASFNYVLPLDADDKLMPNAIERLEDIILKTRADIVAPSFQEFGLSNRQVILGKPTLEDFKTANRIGYCAAIKRDSLREIGGYNPKMLYGWEDWDIWIDLLSRGKTLVTTQEILWMYRIKEKSMYRDSLEHSEFLTKQMRLNHPQVYEMATK